ATTLELMNTQITNIRMRDGSRHFVSLPESRTPGQVFRHIFKLGFAIPYFYLSTPVECWIDFWFRGYRFTINSQFGGYWFFVKNPACPEALLQRVLAHFAAFLGEASR